MTAVVLHSGGLDSTVCLLMALRNKRTVVSLGIDYGQRHAIELEYAATQCRYYGVERRMLRVEWDKPVRQMPLDRSIDEMRSSISPAFLPGRNLLFLSVAAAEAAGIGAEEIWIGVNAIDFSGYPDCRPEFVNAFRTTLRLAIPNGPEVVAPLVALSKSEIAREAIQLGISKTDTWSCYRPHITETGVAPCRRCDACILNDQAWRELETS